MALPITLTVNIQNPGQTYWFHWKWPFPDVDRTPYLVLAQRHFEGPYEQIYLAEGLKAASSELKRVLTAGLYEHGYIAVMVGEGQIVRK